MNRRLLIVSIVLSALSATVLGQSQKSATAKMSGTHQHVAATTTEKGPSEKEMLTAVQARLDNYNRGMKTMIERCKNGDVRNDTVMALSCLSLYSVTNTSYDLTASITRFHSYGCVSAAAIGKPGYVCDYIVGFSQNSPVMTGVLGKVAAAGDMASARFVRDDSGWIMISDPPR